MFLEKALFISGIIKNNLQVDRILFLPKTVEILKKLKVHKFSVMQSETILYEYGGKEHMQDFS